jgi:hypothetical protein
MHVEENKAGPSETGYRVGASNRVADNPKEGLMLREGFRSP